MQVDLRQVDDYFTCPICKRRRPSELYSRDHILPKSWGGSDSPDNLRPCCRPCNMNLQAAAECVAVLACARWIAIDGNYETYVFEGRLNRKIRKLLSEWRPWQYVAFVAPNTPKAVVLPGSTHARTAGITWLKRTYSRSSKGWV